MSKNPNVAPVNTERQLNPTPAEYGFIHQEQGPLFIPETGNVPEAYRNAVDRPLPTQLLLTDQKNPVLITSLIGRHTGASNIASKIEEGKGRTQYSDDVQAYFLRSVKRYVDDGPSAVKTVKNASTFCFYDGNVQVSNGRMLRVYMAPIGSYEGIPVIAKIGASRTKEAETKLYRTLNLTNTKFKK